jgi:hypothetical protein
MIFQTVLISVPHRPSRRWDVVAAPNGQRVPALPLIEEPSIVAAGLLSRADSSAASATAGLVWDGERGCGERDDEQCELHC